MCLSLWLRERTSMRTRTRETWEELPSVGKELRRFCLWEREREREIRRSILFSFGVWTWGTLRLGMLRNVIRHRLSHKSCLDSVSFYGRVFSCSFNCSLVVYMWIESSLLPSLLLPLLLYVCLNCFWWLTRSPSYTVYWLSWKLFSSLAQFSSPSSNRLKNSHHSPV